MTPTLPLRSTSLLTLIIASLLACNSSMVSTRAATEKLMVRPKTVEAGTDYLVLGSGFVPKQAVTLTVADPTCCTRLVRVADDDGLFDVTLSAGPGGHYVLKAYAEGGTSHAPLAELEFDVAERSTFTGDAMPGGTTPTPDSGAGVGTTPPSTTPPPTTPPAMTPPTVPMMPGGGTDAGAASPSVPATTLPLTPGCPSNNAWAFCESFDGNPAHPTPYSTPRMDIVVGENAAAAVMNGQTINPDSSISYGTIETGFGPNCEAPSKMTRNLLIDETLEGFQQNSRQHLVFNCSSRLVTVVKSGYAITSFMPRQPFDWAGRNGVLEFKTNLHSFARLWWDVYLMPEEDALLESAHKDEGGGGEQFPRRAVIMSFANMAPKVIVVDNYQAQPGSFSHWERFNTAFPTDPAPNNPDILRTFRFTLSTTAWKFEVEKQDGTFWTFTGTFPKPLTFSRAYARFQHHAYNPTKDGIKGTPWSQFTYQWDDVRFDGPVVPGHVAYEPGPHFLNLMRDPSPTEVRGVTIDVPVVPPATATLVGHLFSDLNFDDVDPANSAHWRQVRVNGGAWLDLPLVKQAPTNTAGRAWSTVRLTLQGVIHQGPNLVEFRYPVRPAQATWHRNGFRVKDLEIQLR